jgi:ABC-type amino acid transport substrate-binding protein
MRHSPRTVVLLLCALLILPGSNLPAQESEGTLEKIARTGEFLIGYRTDSRPLSYENADGKPSGYSVDVCQHIAADVNAHFGDKDIKTKFIPVTSDERISAVVNGKIDIECGSTTITLSRQEQVDFTLPTFVTGGSVLSLAGTGIQSMSDLSGKIVGVAKGTTTIEQLQHHLQQDRIAAKIFIVDDREDGMNRLNQGEIGAFASDQIVLIGQVAEADNPKRYSLVNDVFSFEPYGFVVRRDDADFRLVVNRSIAQLYRDGEQGEIFYKWIGRIGINVPPILSAMYQLNAIPE